MPVAVAYDLVLEDHVIAKQKVKRSQKAFSREIAELVRYAVGYRSRAFVTFGKPISLDGIDPESKKAVMDLTRHVRSGDRQALQGAADRGAGRGDDAVGDAGRAEGRIDAVLDTLRSVDANLSVQSADEVLSTSPPNRWSRATSSSSSRGRYRVRERNVLRYYARSLALAALCSSPARAAHPLNDPP